MATVADLVLKKEGILLYYVLKDVMFLGGLWFPLPAANNESQNVVIITKSLCIDS